MRQALYAFLLCQTVILYGYSFFFSPALFFLPLPAILFYLLRQNHIHELQRQSQKACLLGSLDQLQRLNELGKLSANILHDLVSPLTCVIVNLERLPSSQDSELIQRAIASTKHIERIIQESRRQIRKQKVWELFSPICEISDTLPLAAHRNIPVHFHYSCKGSLYGSPIRFSQLVLNLINNAIEATLMSGHTKAVHISLQEYPNTISLTVQDFGQGIDPQDLDSIFYPFFSTKSQEMNLGLGLAICKDIIEQDFKGTICVKSKKGRGTTFEVTFPKPDSGESSDFMIW